MTNFLTKTSKSVWYWLAILVLGIAMEMVALFYQYQLHYGPCAVCIHVRIYVLGFIVVALLTISVRQYRGLRVIAHLTTLLLSLGLAERAWNLLGTERGFIEGACGMMLGMPSWFALDKWLPSMFEPWEPCGQTPPLLFGISMAEGLVVFSVFAILTTAIMTLFALKK